MPALPFEYVGGLQAFLHFYYFFIAHQLSYITHSNSGEGLLFYGDVTIPFVDRFPRGEIYNLLTTRPEDLKNEAKTE